MNPHMTAIRKYFPHLVFDKVETMDHGMNNAIYVLDDTYIFRFPKTEINRKALEREVACLDILKDHVTFRVPEFDYVHMGTLEETFVGYRMIPGDMLTKERFTTLDHEKLGRQLAKILVELHDPKLVPLLSPYLESVDDHQVWEDMYHRIQSQLFDFIHPKHHEAITRDFQNILKGVSGQNFKKTVVHGDFGPSNILVNDQSEITGIIDFGMVHIGDPAGDISSMIGPFGYGRDFIENHFKDYEGALDMLERAVLFTKSFALQDALYGFEHQDEEAFEFGIRGYRG